MFKVFATGVPKPSANHFVVINDMNDTGFSCTLAISTTSDIGFACNSTTASRYYGNFSYPVAE